MKIKYLKIVTDGTIKFITKEYYIWYNMVTSKFEKTYFNNIQGWVSKDSFYLSCAVSTTKNYVIIGHGFDINQTRKYKTYFLNIDTNNIDFEINDVLVPHIINDDFIYFTNTHSSEIIRFNLIDRILDFTRNSKKGIRVWNEKYFIYSNFNKDDLITCFNPITGLDQWTLDFSNEDFNYIKDFKTQIPGWYINKDDVWFPFKDGSVGCISLKEGKLIYYLPFDQLSTPYGSWSYDYYKHTFFKYFDGKINEVDCMSKTYTSYEISGMSSYSINSFNHQLHFDNYFIFVTLRPIGNLVVFNKVTKEIEWEYNVYKEHNITLSGTAGIKVENGYLILNDLGNRSIIFKIHCIEI